MKTIAAFICFAVCFCGAIGGCVYLVMHDHPWFALFVLIVGGSLSVKHDESSAKTED